MANSPSSPKTTILIVEDESIIRMMIAEVVRDSGFQVLEASNADEAVCILESRLDVSIVFTDIDMPGSMDGVKLASVIRGRWPPVEIVITSGLHAPKADELPERCLFIPKPYEAERIVATLHRLAA